MTPRRASLGTWLARGLVAGVLLSAGHRAPSQAGDARPLAGSRPNVILIIADDLGYGDLSCHGNPVIRTPHLDRLAAEGLRHRAFHVSPTCAPTRCALLTGRHEFRSGVTHTIAERERLAPAAVTFPELLARAGYATGIFGKWHLGDEAAYRPDRRGFAEYLIHGAGGIGQTFPGSCGDAPGNSYFGPVLLRNGVFEKTTGYCADEFFNRALAWIDSVRGQGPFYCHIATNTPHAPLICPPKYEARFQGRGLTADQAKFYGMVANLDDNVGRLLDHLARQGLERDTLVLFLNDNGGTVGVPIGNAGMRGHKGTPYEGGTRACLFARWPDRLAPREVPELTAHLDLFPTLAALAGAELPAGLELDGYSLLPLWQASDATWPARSLVTHVGRWPAGEARQSQYRQASVRRGPWQLVFTGEPGGALYHLVEDPAATRDRAAEEPALAAELRAYFDRWWAEILPGLVNEEAAATAPGINAFKELYWRQYRGPGPNQVPPPAGFFPAEGSVPGDEGGAERL